MPGTVAPPSSRGGSPANKSSKYVLNYDNFIVTGFIIHPHTLFTHTHIHSFIHGPTHIRPPQPLLVLPSRVLGVQAAANDVLTSGQSTSSPQDHTVSVW